MALQSVEAFLLKAPEGAMVQLVPFQGFPHFS